MRYIRMKIGISKGMPIHLPSTLAILFDQRLGEIVTIEIGHRKFGSVLVVGIGSMQSGWNWAIQD